MRTLNPIPEGKAEGAHATLKVSFEMVLIVQATTQQDGAHMHAADSTHKASSSFCGLRRCG